MPCYKPLQALSTDGVNGKKVITILGSKKDDFDDSFLNFTPPHDHPVSEWCHSQSPTTSLTLPCGQCVGCRLDRSRNWALRSIHEASLYEDNCFITLTYRPEDVPPNGSLVKQDFTNFIKRLRFQYGSGIRFYMCGEYGENFSRPHYHALLFNFDFADKRFFKTSHGNKLYTSDSLSRLWPFGYHWIGTVTYNSAAYIARYCLKKVNGLMSDFHYSRQDKNGCSYSLVPEYNNMSRKPGIGSDWFKKYQSDVFPHDSVVHDGKKLRVPRYYDKLFEIKYPDDYERIKSLRSEKALRHQADNTVTRLQVKEYCQIARLGRLKRDFEQLGV